MENSFFNLSNDFSKSITNKFLNTKFNLNQKKKLNNRHLSIDQFRDKLKSQDQLNRTKNSNFDKNSLLNKKIKSIKKDTAASVESLINNTEKDINLLTSMYFFTGGEIAPKFRDKNDIKNTKYYDPKEILSKYNLSTNMNDIEKQEINNFMKTESNFRKTATSLKSQTSSFNRYFLNPYNSFKKIKLNKKIYDNHSKITNDIKKKAVIDKINEMDDFNKKIIKMPEIRIKLKDNKTRIDINSIESDHIDDNTEKSNLYFTKDEFTMASTIKHTTLQYHAILLQNVKNKPRARKNCSILVVKNKMWLFGGCSDEKLGDLWVIDLNECNNWINLKPKGLTNLGRSGNTMVYYKNSLLIWGGTVEFEIYPKRDNILIYEIASNRIFFEKCLNNSDLRNRREHIAEIIGDMMFIYGGIDDEGRILNDMWALDLIYLKWENISTYKKAPNLAYHSSALVLRNQKKNSPYINLFKFTDLFKRDPSMKIISEGIYVFGGKEDNGKFSNQLIIIKFGKQIFDIIKLKTTGKPPAPRISTSLTFSEELYFCVVFGGKDEYENIYKDIFLISLDSFKWVEVHVFNQLPRDTCEHSASLYNNTKVIIFGGINNLKYLGSDIYMINFDVFERKNRAKSFYQNDKKEVKETIESKVLSEEDLVKSISLKNLRKSVLNKKSSSHYSSKNILEKLIRHESEVNFPQKIQNLFMNSRKILEENTDTQVFHFKEDKSPLFETNEHNL